MTPQPPQPANTQAVPLRRDGQYWLVEQREGGDVQVHQFNAMSASLALQMFNLELDYVTDGYAGVRLSRVGNVTTVHFTHHEPIRFWFTSAPPAAVDDADAGTGKATEGQ